MSSAKFQGRIAREDHQAQGPCESCVLPHGTGEDVEAACSAPFWWVLKAVNDHVSTRSFEIRGIAALRTRPNTFGKRCVNVNAHLGGCKLNLSEWKNHALTGRNVA